MDAIAAIAWAAAAVLTLAVWGAWQGGAIGWIGRAVLVVLTLVFTAIAVALLWTAQKMHWTSDGPGMLLILMGLVLSALLAFGLGTATIKARARRRRADTEARGPAVVETGRRPASARRAMPIAVLALCVIASGWYGWHALRNKPAHDAAIVAARFPAGKEQAWSMDVDGGLAIWSLTSTLPAGNQAASPYRLDARVAVPCVPRCRDMWVASDGRHIAVLEGTGVTLLEVDTSQRQARALYKVSDATSAVAVPMTAEFIVVSPQGLRWFRPATAQPIATLPWKTRIVAIDAAAGGAVAFADETGKVMLARAPGEAVVALGTVSFAVSALSFNGEGSAVLVAGVGSPARVFDVAGGASRPSQAVWVEVARPLPGGFVLACSLRGVSCEVVDTGNGNSLGAFNGVGLIGIARRYDHVATAPGVALIASNADLFVVTLSAKNVQVGSAPLKDPRF